MRWYRTMAEAVLRAVRDRVMQLDVSWKGFGQLRGLPASDMLAVALLLVVFVTLVCALAQLEKHFSQEQGLPGKCCKEAEGIGTAPSSPPSLLYQHWLAHGVVRQSRPSAGPVHV